MFDCSCFASFSYVFVAGFNITCPVRFLEAYAGLPKPINRGLSELMVMRMGKWSLASEVETDPSDSGVMPLEAKLM